MSKGETGEVDEQTAKHEREAVRTFYPIRVDMVGAIGLEPMTSCV
jgi:hypothetical protein